MRNSLPSMRSVLPTLLPPPNSFSLSALRDHGDARGRVVLGLRPAAAVQERRVEHREEIGRGVARVDAERIAGPCAAGSMPTPPPVIIAWRSPRWLAQQRLGVEAGHLVRPAPRPAV